MQYEADIQSPHRDLFLSARELLLSYEGMTETKKPRITTYSMPSGNICHLRSMPYGIDFGFLKGAKIEDTYKLLSGDGKAMRVLAVKDRLDEDIAQYYLKQAIALIDNK